ncbi:MAG: NifU family protein [Gemmatimonadetes bacterium]|nr:NifU family protein [Gemmatimonadota bacterium]
MASRIQALLDEQIRPLTLERGGDLVFHSFSDGIVKLELVGSPGALLPLRAHIEGMIRHYIREDTALVFVTKSVGSEGGMRETKGSLSERVQLVLNEQINPAVKAHGGAIQLVEVKDNTAYLQFEGRCQGCAMADVTLRQGVEVMIKEQVAEIIAVVDVTDHTSGIDPYFKTKKGPD